MPTLLKIDASDPDEYDKVKHFDIKLDNDNYWTDGGKWPMITTLAKSGEVVFGGARLVGNVASQRNWVIKYKFENTDYMKIENDEDLLAFEFVNINS